MKKALGWIIGIIVVVGVIFGIHIFSTARQNQASKSSTITIGAIGPDVQVWQHIAKSAVAKKAGLKIKVRSFTDGTTLNNATSQDSIDVNAFQSWSYLEAYNEEHKNGQQVALGTTYLEPMGLYSAKYKSVKQIPDGATIAIANNPANTARGLLLLQSAGLIKLKKNFNKGTGDVTDIASNPKHLKFKKIDDTTGPRVIKSVDAVVIGNTIALAGHLNVLTDSIYHEKVGQNTVQNINVLATAKKNKNNPNYRKLVKLYHNKAIQKWIAKKYDGTKVEVQRPISYLQKNN